jgi:hypothetical protein
MLELAVIVHNPAAESVVAGLGIVIVASVAAVVIALWVVVARRRAGRDEREPDEGLETLRHLDLVVRKPRGPGSVEVAELKRDAETGATAADLARPAPARGR